MTIGPQSFEERVGQLPAAQAVDMVIQRAVQGQFSEIRLVPDSDSALVLFGLKGKLQQMAVLRRSLCQGMISHIKAQAGMDIAKTRQPQNGIFSVMVGEKEVNFGVSSKGVIFGEMMIIRIPRIPDRS